METDDKQRVLEAIDIADVIGTECALKPKGREFVCLCPFHDDRNPSMYVVPHKQFFHCFVCGAGGNAIDFVMRYHGMGFREALEHLANHAGIELKPFSRRAGGNGRQQADRAAPDERGTTGFSRDDLARANTFALDFYRQILTHPEHGEAARDAIERRGIVPEMVDAFGLGAAPDRFDGLVKTIAARGLDPSVFEAAGLLKRREQSGGHYDALRNRLIFPILDRAGRPIGFGGRVINPGDNPKYLNSPETPLFQKSSTLYGIQQAWAGIRREKSVVVTEGYTDVIACHQAGFDNVVATLGTALTPGHAALVRRVVDRVILLFDGDEAGRRAADRALEVFFTEPLDVGIAVIPGGADPDDLLKTADGCEAFRQVLANATDALDYRFGRLGERLASSAFGSGSQARAALIEEDLRRLVDLGLTRLSPLRQATVCRRYADLAGTDEGTVRRSLAALRKRPSLTRPVERQTTPDEIDERAEAAQRAARAQPRTPGDHAIACLLARPALLDTPENTWQDQYNTDAQSSSSDRAYLENLSGFLQNAAYSSAAAQRIARRIGRWVNNIANERQAPATTGAASDPNLDTPEGTGSAQAGLAAGNDLLRLVEGSEDQEEVGIARSFMIAVERACEGDDTRLRVVWRDSIAELARRAEILGGRATQMSPVSTGEHGQAPEPGDEVNSRPRDLDAAIQAARAAQARGGNPRAMPRPRG